MGKDKRTDGVPEDPIDGLLPDDEEGPTLTLGTLEGVLGSSSGPANPSIGSFVASEEAMRVFDEMSNPGGDYSVPGGYSVRYRGRAEDQSLVDTLAPFPERQPAPPDLDLDLADLPPPLPTAPKLPAGVHASARTASREGYLVFEHCPCPLFRLDGGGRILAANQALCEFLGARVEELLGQFLHGTRLGLLSAGLERDIQGSLSARAGLQRFLSFEDASQNTVRFLLWIVPIPPSPGRPNPFAGIILPFPGE